MTHPQFWPISILLAEKFPLGELPISFAMNHFIMFHTIQDNPRHLRGPITGSVVSTTFGKLPWLSLWRPTRWTDPPANGSCSKSRGLESCSLGSNHRPKDQAILIDWLSHGKSFKICVEIWYMWSFNVIYPTNWDVFLGIMAWCSQFVNAVRLTGSACGHWKCDLHGHSSEKQGHLWCLPSCQRRERTVPALFVVRDPRGTLWNTWRVPDNWRSNMGIPWDTQKVPK